VVVEREELKEAQLRHEEEINRLKTDLAILKRDRLNLQFAYDGAQREMGQLRRKVNGEEEEPALPPVEAAAVVAAQAGEVRIEVPKAAAPYFTRVPAPAPVTPAPDEVAVPVAEPEVPEPLAPAASLPFKPVAKPFVPLAKAPAAPLAPTTPSQSTKPPAPFGLPQKPAAVPSGAANAVRPLPRPAGAPVNAESKPAASAPTVISRGGHRPLPAVKPLPTVKMNPVPVPAPKIGPKGTQKISE
jgi:hypothetical protein